MRKLASIVVVDGLSPIEGKDRIEIAIVGGWQVIVQKGLYEVGHSAVFFEIDSMLNTEKFPDTAKWSSKLMHEVNGVTYARVKTMKMGGTISQGYMMPVSEVLDHDSEITVGMDLTEALGVLKYESHEERERNEGLDKQSRPKTFPDFIPKTDQNRVQNMTALYLKAVENNEEFEVTVKLDGSSLTAWAKPEENLAGVCSRNVGFDIRDRERPFMETLKDFIHQVWKRRLPFAKAKWNRIIPKSDNAFTRMANDSGLVQAIEKDGRAMAIQGEMVGPKIQKNFEGVKENTFYCYDIYLIDEKRYMHPIERQLFCAEHGINHVPILHVGPLQEPTIPGVISYASGPSGLNGKYREGLVFKSLTNDKFSFKVISNEYLLKEK